MEQQRPAVTPAVFGMWHPVQERGVVLDAFGAPETGYSLRVSEVSQSGDRVERLESFASQDELVQRWNRLMSDIMNNGYHDSLLVPPRTGFIFVPHAGRAN